MAVIKASPLESYDLVEATEADLPAILEIYNERVRNSTSLLVYDPVPLDNRKTWLLDAQAKGYPVIVAKDKNTKETVAYASLGQYRPHNAYILAAEVSVYVDQNHHRRGLGRLLLEELIRIGQQMKLRSLIASITSENAPSIQLFEKYQFTMAGTFHDVGYKFGRFVDVTFLERLLDVEVKFDGAAAFVPFPWGNYKCLA
ncbi:acyl-CoA N-acyltransferase [Hesseltinella vesiculosa]|uniref:Acyl-CoA N-acyltransferase n=1 Tax=Hesseltinella vesiculosa TaxID=101127 RepID=A0A1X2GW97_9FUNG|nr:acyl-CoA N-acyltransferase [Hesseltinella vesiculosa]